jgi:alkylation response protein AidB-like acyl-CoA dehydrogenase
LQHEHKNNCTEAERHPLSIAIDPEQRELERLARSFLESRGAKAAARNLLDAPCDVLPDFWPELVALGWTGLHISEAHGGAGFGLPELAVILFEYGRAVAPGPLLSTTLTSAVIAHCGSAAQQRTWLPALASGSAIAATGLGGSLTRSEDGAVIGSAGLVLCAEVATLLTLAVEDDLVLIEADSPGVVIESRKNLDPTRRVAMVRCENVRPRGDATLVGAARIARQLGRTLAAAEASGGALACMEMASEYAKIREQFGRPIGSFQAIKHHCANMLVATELATAASWDAARAAGAGSQTDNEQIELTSAVAATIALPAFDRCASLNIQVHGGIGYTWEHDAHIYLRRAAALLAVFGPVEQAQEQVSRLRARGVRRELSLPLPPESERYRAAVRAFATRCKQLGAQERRAALVAEGYLMPHWPRPWGRDASPAEQLVIEQEFAGLKRPDLGIGSWVVPALVQHGSATQVERWVTPTLLGELRWCQLFSEPGAGSDAAAIRTRGLRVDNGWRVTGQKVWTSAAQECNRGLATIRTDTALPKREGITVMVIDLHAPGVEVRPLREITGHALFNEVFFNDVFVPDSDVVGAVNAGWQVARSTLGNERVSIGGENYSYAPDLAGLLERAAAAGQGDWRDAGALLAEGQAMRAMQLRQTARAIAGDVSRNDGIVNKLLKSEHSQRVGELCMRMIGGEAALLEGEASAITQAHLFLRCLTIGGGTSEIMRNQIAERLLGLPREFDE